MLSCPIVGEGFPLPRTPNVTKNREAKRLPYKRISAENLFSLPICDIMGLTKSLSLWERWRRSRRRGQIVATTTLSPATAGALPKGEPFRRVHLQGYGLCPMCLCITKAKLAIKHNDKKEFDKGGYLNEKNKIS